MIELRPAKYLLGRLAPMDNNDKIPQFNLGAGTYNSTVFLRGDGVWADPLAAGFVPTSRTLTINGVTYDLSANRTWTIDKASVGLGNVDNTSDANKPISTATQTALNLKEDKANKGIPNGYASLAGDGKVPSTQLPSYVDDVIEVANYAALPTIGETGVIYITLDNNNVYRWSGSVYVQISQPNAVWGSITGTLSNQVDLQAALNAKQNNITLTTTGTSGAATLIGATLNIPRYDSSLIGYVPYTGATGNVNLGEYGLSAGWVQIDTTPTTYTPGVGKLGWNDQDGTLEFQLIGGNVTLQIGQEQVARVVNKTDPSIDLLESNYQVVKITGAQGNRLKVALAQANNDANSAETLGIVTEDIPRNQEGFITTSGLVKNINTTGSLQGETWADGDMLYLSGTVAGKITKVKPSAPIHTVILGYVVRAHATQGQIYVKVDNGYELGELHDVNTTISKTTPIDTDSVLLQDTADSNIWKKLSWLNTKATLKTYFDTLYQAIGNYVPTSRTITINSTTQDLSANRSWTIDKASVGLGNVDNTSDLNKPISTATQTALNAKQDNITLTTTGTSGAATLVGATLNIPHYQSALTNPITGTGTLNYIPKFTASGSIGDSQIYDNGFQIGIGTTLPNAKLGVAGTIKNEQYHYITNTYDGRGIYADDGGGSTIFSLTRQPSNEVRLQGYSSLTFFTDGSTGTEKMRITYDGKIGMGVSNPASKLHLSGATTLLTITDTTYNRTSQIGYLDQANLYFANDSNSNTYIGRYNNVFLAYGGGNVGIGTETPLQKLHVLGNILLPVSNSLFFVPASTNYGIGTPNSDGVQIFTGAGDSIRLGHMSGVNTFTERMRIAGNGSIGIGTTNPLAKLDILNKVLIGEDQTYGGYYGIGWGGLTNGYNRVFAQSLGGAGDGLFLASATGKGIYFRPNGSTIDALTVAPNNYIGINTTNPTYPLHLNHPSGETGILTSYGSANIYLSHGGWGMGANKFGIGNGFFPSIIVNGANSNVGVGTTNPIWKFVVSNGGAAGLEIDPDNGSAGYVGVYSYNRASGSYFPLMLQAANYYFTIGSVGIGTTSINSSAILDLTSTTKGFLPPRMNDAEMNAISSPATGLMVWNNDIGSLFVFDGGAWKKIAYA